MERGEFTSAGAPSTQLLMIDADTMSAVVAAITAAPAVRDCVNRQDVDFDVDGFARLLRQLIADALDVAVQDRRRAAEIRAFFEGATASYTLLDLAVLWRIPLPDVCAIFSDHVATARLRSGSPATFAVRWIDAVSAATVFNLFRAVEVERALGPDLGRLRSEAWRTRPVLVHLPQFIVDAIKSTTSVPSEIPLEARTEQFIADVCEGEWVLRAVLATSDSGDTCE